MVTQHYFPPSEAERIIWLNNYGTYLSKYGQLLGVGTEEITNTQKDIASYVWISQTWYGILLRSSLRGKLQRLELQWQRVAVKNLCACQCFQ